MNRQFYLDLAAQGLRMPIGTHLILHTKPDHHAILLDGARLGDVAVEAAHEFHTPLAVPLMDLAIEKAMLLGLLNVPEAEVETFHFSTRPESGLAQRVARFDTLLNVRANVTCAAIQRVARSTDLTPLGMSIGPFSLMTKLVSDAISPVYMAGTGLTAADDPEVAVVEDLIEAGTEVILRYHAAQAAAGAKAIIVCEPAANTSFFSPHQLEQNIEVFDRYVMEPNRRLKQQLEKLGVDLIFHDCGELTNDLVRRFATLDPAMLSLGSSRTLWDDAALLPKDIVLYGNLPSKKFYSDDVITRQQVADLAGELLRRMRVVRHPFILGSECDVLCVPGCEDGIRGKVDAFMRA